LDDRSLIDVPHNEGERLLSYRRTPVTTTSNVMRRNGLCVGKRGGGCSGRRDLTHHRLQIPDEFARDVHHGDLWPTPHRESMVHRVQAPLCLPRV